MLTDRDKNILKLINRFGFLGIAEIKRAWEITSHEVLGEKKLYHRMKILKDLNLVHHKRVVYGRPGVYYLTQKGAEVSESELSAISEINLISYSHRIEVNRILIKLLEKYPNSIAVTERELFKRAYLESGKVLGEAAKAKIPDGLLIHENGAKDAVEVELTKKTNSRLLQQTKRYREELNLNKYNRVLYFCSRDSIIDSLSFIVQNLNIANKILILKFNREDKFKG